MYIYDYIYMYILFFNRLVDGTRFNDTNRSLSPVQALVLLIERNNKCNRSLCIYSCVHIVLDILFQSSFVIICTGIIYRVRQVRCSPYAFKDFHLNL